MNQPKFRAGDLVKLGKGGVTTYKVLYVHREDHNREVYYAIAYKGDIPAGVKESDLVLAGQQVYITGSKQMLLEQPSWPTAFEAYNVIIKDDVITKVERV